MASELNSDSTLTAKDEVRDDCVEVSDFAVLWEIWGSERVTEMKHEITLMPGS